MRKNKEGNVNVMNKKIIIGIIAAIAIIVIAIVCAVGIGGKKTVSFTDEEDTKATMSLSFSKKANYTLSTNKEDFRTTRDDAILKGDSFNITFQFTKYFGNETLANIKEERKDSEEFKDVTYNKMNGFSYYYPSYVTYKVVLPVSESVYAELCIFPKDIMSSKQEEAKAAYESEAVQKILNNISFSVAE